MRCANFKSDYEIEFSRYVCTNFVQVSVEEEFFDLPKDTILSLLASEDLRVDSEYQVFMAAMTWLYHDVGSRRRYIYLKK